MAGGLPGPDVPFGDLSATIVIRRPRLHSSCRNDVPAAARKFVLRASRRGNLMKITQVHSQIVQFPAVEPLADGPSAPGATRTFVTLRLGTDEGIEGIGMTFFGGALTQAL